MKKLVLLFSLAVVASPLGFSGFSSSVNARQKFEPNQGEIYSNRGGGEQRRRPHRLEGVDRSDLMYARKGGSPSHGRG